MLPATPASWVERAGHQPASVRTRYAAVLAATSMSPSRSVRWTAIPGRDCSTASVSGAGCPYVFPSPDEMTATEGLTASSSAAVVELVDP
jgi:hypothetical protein